MSPDRPSLVFIHGSWHTPACYNRIISPLETEHGFKCVTVTLPSTTGDPDATFKDDVDAAYHLISTETSQGRNVVVLAHSYGGMIGNSAIKGLTAPKHPASDSSNPGVGHVIGLILIASGFTLTGLAFMDPVFGTPPPAWRVNKTTGFAELALPPRELFYHDLPTDEAEYWVSQLTHQNLKALFEGGEHAYAGWMDVPTWYIGTSEDRGLPVAVQRVTVGMARGIGGMVVHRELRSSHSPFLSLPGEVIEIVLDAVGAFTSNGDDKQGLRRDGSSVVPAMRLLQPGTWLRFGLPLGIGRVLGWGYSGFLGLRKLLRWR